MALREDSSPGSPARTFLSSLLPENEGGGGELRIRDDKVRVGWPNDAFV